MQRNGQFVWTKKTIEAAQLVADDKLKDEEIAAKLDINRATLTRWKQDPEFQARIKEHVDAWKARIMQRGLALKERRIETYLEDWEATEIIRQERGNQLSGQVDVESNPYAGGARTGFIARDYKGKDANVAVYQFDAALFRERRELRKQIAQECGQWSDKTEITGKDGGPIVTRDAPDLSSLTDEELADYERLLTKALAKEKP